ncbi:MAG: hypothetical protein ACXVPN_12450 [Bacteroidia bacterium]
MISIHIKKPSFLFLSFVSVLFILQSCAIEKRHYTSGFYVSGSSSPSKKSPVAVTKENTVSIREVKHDVEKQEILKYRAKKSALANSGNETTSKSSLQNFKPVFKAVKDSCDTLVLTNGTEILVKVLEISPRLIRYKHCDNPDGPIYNVAASDIAKVIFSNGSKEEFKMEQPIADYNSVLVSPSRIRRTSNLALLFGIVSIPALVLYLAGILFAILAIKNARAAMRWYNKDPRSFDPANKSKAQIGFIFAMISLALVALGIIALFMYFMGFFR